MKPQSEFNANSIVIGCNYHVKWQKKKGMRFVLVEIDNNRVRLETRVTKKSFWTNISDLIFIESNHNIRKARKLVNNQINTNNDGDDKN